MRRLAAALFACSLFGATARADHFAQAPAAAAALGAPMPTQVNDETFMEAPVAATHAPSRALVVKALARRRAANVARFHAYRIAGVYPHNLQPGSTRNIWRDADGHLCAAATMIDRSGQHELVADIADHATYVRLGEVTDGPLLDWILTSGLTQVEIATIQEPMMGPREVPKPRDNRWRITEDARLRTRYVRIEAGLKDNRASAVEQAADRLLENPALAWSLVGAELGVSAS